LLVSKNTCLVEKNGGGNTGADAPVPVFKPPPVTNVIEIFTLVGFDFLQ
jgi:K+-transporting ATPase A subunit